MANGTSISTEDCSVDILRRHSTARYDVAPPKTLGVQVSGTDPDRQIRWAAIHWVRELHKRYGTLEWSQISDGFPFHGETIRLATKARGIFKPKQMETLLSIRTGIPRAGRRVWYEDQRIIQQAVFGKSEHFEYSLMKGAGADRVNALIKQAHDLRLAIIYFVGVAPTLYEPIVPTYIYDFDAFSGKCFVGPGQSSEPATKIIEHGFPEDLDGRRYRVGLAQQRMHQSMFRAIVLNAYGNRCAITGLPVPRLLDAAHIIEDKHEQLGQPVVQNGLPLSKIHHAAFDADLIGIDPDHKVHLSTKLLDEDDGPMLDLLKGCVGKKIHPPKHRQDYPDPARLEARFNRFRPNL